MSATEVDSQPRRALVSQAGTRAGHLTELSPGRWQFTYLPGYAGPPVSLALPVREAPYAFDAFPPFLDGLLPEGLQLEALLRQLKIDRSDRFAQLLAVGQDMVGSLTVTGEGAGS